MSDAPFWWPYVKSTAYPVPQPQPAWTVTTVTTALPHGCICPAGANVACENPHCPRKPARPPSAGGATP